LPGFDLTLALAALNIGCFLLLLTHLDAELAAVRQEESGRP